MNEVNFALQILWLYDITDIDSKYKVNTLKQTSQRETIFISSLNIKYERWKIQPSHQKC